MQQQNARGKWYNVAIPNSKTPRICFSIKKDTEHRIKKAYIRLIVFLDTGANIAIVHVGNVFLLFQADEGGAGF
jgi:hypothetical protein